jgi:hypothetical protein
MLQSKTIIYGPSILANVTILENIKTLIVEADSSLNGYVWLYFTLTDSVMYFASAQFLHWQTVLCILLLLSSYTDRQCNVFCFYSVPTLTDSVMYFASAQFLHWQTVLCILLLLSSYTDRQCYVFCLCSVPTLTDSVMYFASAQFLYWQTVLCIWAEAKYITLSISVGTEQKQNT